MSTYPYQVHSLTASTDSKSVLMCIRSSRPVCRRLSILPRRCGWKSHRVGTTCMYLCCVCVLCECCVHMCLHAHVDRHHSVTSACTVLFEPIFVLMFTFTCCVHLRALMRECVHILFSLLGCLILILIFIFLFFGNPKVFRHH